MTGDLNPPAICQPTTQKSPISGIAPRKCLPPIAGKTKLVGLRTLSEAFFILRITLNSSKPLKTSIGNFEWQIITGKLESSGYLPGNPDSEYSKTKYVPKINQLGETDDWRYLQGYTFTYSPSQP